MCHGNNRGICSNYVSVTSLVSKPQITGTSAKAADNFEAYEGENLFILGTGFTPGANTVYIGGYVAKITNESSTRVDVVVPTIYIGDKDYAMLKVFTKNGMSNEVKLRYHARAKSPYIHPADTDNDWKIDSNEVVAYGNGEHAVSANDIWEFGADNRYGYYSGRAIGPQFWFPYHPADTNIDRAITSSELSAYGSGQYIDSATDVVQTATNGVYYWDEYNRTWNNGKG